MDIGPVDKNKRVSEQPPAERESVKKHAIRKRQKKDRLQISEESRRIQAADVQKKNNAEWAEALRNEKLKAVKKRVADGFYNRSEIKGKVAEILSGNEDMLGPADVEVDSAEATDAELENLSGSPDEENDDLGRNQPPPNAGI